MLSNRLRNEAFDSSKCQGTKGSGLLGKSIQQFTKKYAHRVQIHKTVTPHILRPLGHASIRKRGYYLVCIGIVGLQFN